ncbi:beta-ketoacyl-ACP synthase 3 [Lacticaseibacillus thailandensis]|uniref:3-oxoacyl-ACP synthase n=1 Tax=Lacticaseibacillus thailandensis DSM 22698 = JCM 13996 TaxID=1423810 RepID=A0A0R2CJK4_9LACO|nr:beta-ketoacyl-ACP synthase 3 [Lacticaseibacillus thailandensis]KRM87891.1 3-oxoacyl-ACP synthase [Lacticaseibacillus thailandensis DSM 22698 = JCM 13996]
MGLTIIGSASAVPAQVVTNDELTRLMTTSDEWIQQRTGIARRHVARTETTDSLAIDVARQLLEQTGVMAAQVGLILVATMSPTYTMPSVAAMVAGAVGAHAAMTADISTACTGFVAALSTAHALALARQTRYVLVIGAEVLTKIVDWHDRSTAILFGDGAGGVMLDMAGTAGAYLGDEFSTQGEHGLDLTADYSGNHSPFAEPQDGDPYFRMNGHAVYNFVVNDAPAVIERLLARTQTALADVDVVVFHQANARMLEHLARKLGLTAAQYPLNLQEYGNTAAASEPILLAELIATGRIQRGNKVLLCAFGGGLTVGAALIEY